MGFVESICASGGIVKDVLVFFDRLQGGQEVLKAQGIQLHSLTDMEIALEMAKNSKFSLEDQVESVREYLRDPRKWHLRCGLPYAD